MKLIIMRHGEAVTSGPMDEDRYLTPNGKQQAHLAGRWLKANLIGNQPVDHCLVSYFVRASQTFSELKDNISCDIVETSSDVLPMSNPQFTHDYLDSLLLDNPSYSSFLIVSHMPFVSFLVEEVTVDRSSMLFDTSSIVIIDYNIERKSGLIEKVYHPD